MAVLKKRPILKVDPYLHKLQLFCQTQTESSWSVQKVQWPATKMIEKGGIIQKFAARYFDEFLFLESIHPCFQPNFFLVSIHCTKHLSFILSSEKYWHCQYSCRDAFYIHLQQGWYWNFTLHNVYIVQYDSPVSKILGVFFFNLDSVLL